MTTELEAYRDMLELLSLDPYYFSVAKESDGSFVLWANTNDVFAPAADAEVIAPDDLKEVLSAYVHAPNQDEPYSAVLEWIGRRNGMVPHAWRKV